MNAYTLIRLLLPRGVSLGQIGESARSDRAAAIYQDASFHVPCFCRKTVNGI